jgi:hypothetical protein
MCLFRHSEGNNGSFYLFSFVLGAVLGRLPEYHSLLATKVWGQVAPYDPGPGAGSKLKIFKTSAKCLWRSQEMCENIRNHNYIA